MYKFQEEKIKMKYEDIFYEILKDEEKWSNNLNMKRKNSMKLGCL